MYPNLTIVQNENRQVNRASTNNRQWETINNKKRHRGSPEGVLLEIKRCQKSLKDYWLSSPDITSKNSYNLLGEVDDNECNGTDKTQNETNNNIKIDSKSLPRSSKPPPIFVCGVENINPLKELLKGTAENNCTLKVLLNNQVKIQPNSAVNYLPIVEKLKGKETEFYICQLKQEKNFKVVLRNMHPSVDSTEIN